MTVPDIFDEVDEDLRAERARKMLQRYGGVAVLAAVLLVVAVGGWEAWKWHAARENARVAQLFLTALDGAAGPPGDARRAAALQLAEVARDGNAGYRTLARLRAAALKADSGDAAAAQALWAQVAADSSADPLLRDAAVLQSVQHEIDSGDPAVLAGRLKPLVRPDNPWHGLAQEAQALLDLRQGHNDAARDTLKALGQDVTAPDGVRGRANGLLARIGG
jgi:hypothetical protein